MPTYKQSVRPMRVRTALEYDDLLLVGFRGNEAISHLFEFQLELLAENAVEIPFEKLLGQKVNVELDLADGNRAPLRRDLQPGHRRGRATTRSRPTR